MKFIGLQRMASRAGLVLRTHAPEILTFIGIGGFVVTAVTAGQGAIKAQEVVKSHNDMVAQIKEAWKLKGDTKEYSELDRQKDMVTAWVWTIKDMAKIFWKPITFGILSAVSILAAHNILHKRNVAIMAAYRALDGAFEEYKRRTPGNIENSIDREDRKDSAEKGVAPKTKKYVEIYDERGGMHMDKMQDTYKFLHSMQEYANERLQLNGYVFLNEVMRQLCLPEREDGQVVGWIAKEYGGSGVIDFGIDYYLGRIREEPDCRDDMILEFNCDGIIFDKVNWENARQHKVVNVQET